MYEDMTYDKIMASMMADAPDGVDTSEGSLLWNACSKCAMHLEEAYDELDNINNNMMIDTQDLDHLIQGGSECGCPIIEATYAVFTGQFNLAVAIGTRFSHVEQSYTYAVTELIDDTAHTYKLECETAGAEPNAYLGSIEPVDYMEGFETGELLSIITAGADQEDEDVYRQRRKLFYAVKPFGGNKAYYVEQVDDIDGVGGCKVARRTSSATTVDIVIIASDYTVPSSTLVSTVQNAVDPDSGNGGGVAPIGAKVKVSAVTALTVNIGFKLTFDTGYTFDGLLSQIQSAVDTYFKELGKTWEASTESQTVRLAQIETRLLDITGILDCANVTFNGSASNIILGTDEIPVRGTLTNS